jgi:ABC-type sugar transport system permease subunit
MGRSERKRGWKQVLLGATPTASQRRIGFAFVLPTIVYFWGVYFYPLLSSIRLSFYEGGMGRPERFIGLKSYEMVFTDPFFWQTVRNTLYFVILSVPMTVALALGVALLLNRIINNRVRDILSATYFMPLVISLVAAALIWGWIYQPIYGLANYILGFFGIRPQKWLSSISQVMPSLSLINIWLRIGFDTVIFLAALQSIPERLQEAARIDGARDSQVFRYVTLPLLNNQVIMVLMIELIFAFKVFDQVFVTTEGGPANASRVIMMYLYDFAFKWFKFGEASVVAIFIFTSLLAISVIQWVFLRRAAY